MKKLVLVRHGESLWNKENRFTGWTDVDLSEGGKSEAIKGARYLRESHFQFDIAYTSVLKRAIRTLWIILDEMDEMWIPIVNEWRLNERHYGGLQGMNKIEMVNQYGEEQVQLWRRGFDVRPPAMKMDDERYAGKDSRYRSLKKNDIPLTESLKDTIERLEPYWENIIKKDILSGKNVLIVAHGTALEPL